MLDDQGTAGGGPMDETAAAPESPLSLDVDEAILMKENIRLGPFQTQIIECRVKPLIGKSGHVMVLPLKAGESQLGGARSLPPGI